MELQAIFDHCLQAFDGTILAKNWGESGIFYNPGNVLTKGVYMLTVKEKDGENDSASHINRAGVYRLNIGIRKSTFTQMFGHIPKRPAAGCVVDMNYDFTALDTIMPHPVYGWMGWICVLSPSAQTFEALKPLMHESYAFAQEKFRKR
ncbi:MAG: DUF6194 family protein, partial [Defluviitaleaceae bacterium]|nr:DUF6194 family protein [Defluviitaleaceae bacterium]